MSRVARILEPVGRWWGRLSLLQIGTLWLAVTLASGWALMNKAQILLALRAGDTIAADFASRYKLEPTISKVEMAGVKVGVITGVESVEGGGARVEMKLDKGTLERLGSHPEADIRPATFLGGPGLSSYVELTPGGRPGRFTAGEIPAARTSIPVEFDRLFEALDAKARKGITTSVRGLDKMVAGPGAEALARVLEDAPPALRPAAPGLGAMTGQEPGDLARLVDDLGRAAAVLTETDGELEAVVEDMATVAGTLGDRGADMARTNEEMAATLEVTRAGLIALEGSLAKLEATAPAARPAVQRLDELLRRLPPVLAEARLLLGDLRPLAVETRPMFEALAPTSALLRQFLEDLDGPVLARLNDSVAPALMTRSGERNTALYEETGYFLTGLDGIAKYTDPSGAMMNFYMGFSGDSLSPGPAAASAAPRGSAPRWRMQ
jgi:phospholipid/cholesterol/gamma-HCH transport system substrate-binding protein